MNGRLVADEAIPLAHTGHCTKMMSEPDPIDFKKINTKVDLLLARCVTLDKRGNRFRVQCGSERFLELLLNDALFRNIR